nr:zinc finger BED domain-containing protein 4-like [Parasteatoda tepidariorum]
MIAVDKQPYLFVEDEGFRNLMAKAQPQYKVSSREYFKQVIIPKMHLKCKEEIESLLSSATYISLTTNIWFNSVNKDSFINFTAHWIDNDFNYKHFVLNSRHFPGSHTGENVGKMLSSLSEEWNVTSKIYLVIRDGGSNIVKAVNDLNLERNTRKTVKLVQDVSTRWNSTFYMLNRLQELQNAISICANGNNEIQNFSSYQWILIENCIKLLQPFEEITQQISSSKSLISEVIPMVVTLQRYLLKSVEVSGIGTIKEALEKNIHKRVSAIQLNKHYSLATILDPRHKTLFFDKDQSYDEVVKPLLLSLMKKKASEI